MGILVQGIIRVSLKVSVSCVKFNGPRVMANWDLFIVEREIHDFLIEFLAKLFKIHHIQLHIE